MCDALKVMVRPDRPQHPVKATAFNDTRANALNARSYTRRTDRNGRQNGRVGDYNDDQPPNRRFSCSSGETKGGPPTRQIPIGILICNQPNSFHRSAGSILDIQQISGGNSR
jgi:hypothetical protein